MHSSCSPRHSYQNCYFEKNRLKYLKIGVKPRNPSLKAIPEIPTNSCSLDDISIKPEVLIITTNDLNLNRINIISGDMYIYISFVCSVHCVAGVSRSATLCIVYLMKSEQMTLREAYYHVKAVRPIVRPNSGFWKQMIDFEYRQFGSNSVSMVNSKWNEPIPDVYTEELRSGFSSPSLSSNVSIARRRPGTFLGTVVNGDLMFPRL